MKVRSKALTEAHLLVPTALPTDLMRLFWTGRDPAGFYDFHKIISLSGRIHPTGAQLHRLHPKFHITGLVKLG